MHIYRGYDTNDDTDAEAHMNWQRESFLSITQTEKKGAAEKSPSESVIIIES